MSLTLSRPLRELRLAIIGDEDEKRLLLESSDIDVLLSMLTRSPQLKEVLTVLYSVTLTPLEDDVRLKFMSHLVRLGCSGLDDTQFALICSILANIANEVPSGMEFVHVLYTKLIAYDQWSPLYTQIFTLLPHLDSTESQILIEPSLAILSSLAAPIMADLLKKYSTSELYTNCYDLPLLPYSKIKPSEHIYAVLFSLSHMLYEANDIHDAILTKDIYFLLTSFLKADTYELRLAVVSILMNHSVQMQEARCELNIKKLLPSLISLIMDSQTGSNDSNPFHLLSRLCSMFEFVNGVLFDCNLIVNFVEIICQYSKLQIQSLLPLQLNNLSDVFLILSSVTSKNEDNRKMILDDDMLQMIKRVLVFHVENIHKNDPMKSNQLATSASYLLRSLSRSVFNLRSHFGDLEFIPELTEILKFETDLAQATLLKTVVLSIVANLVLDFSPLRKRLLTDDFIQLVGQLIMNTKHDTILVNSLYVARNVFYYEKDVKVRTKMMSQLGYLKMIDLCNHENVQVQEQALNVIRNLTCHEKELLEILSLMGESFFQFLQSKLLQFRPYDEYDSIVECIIYIIVNISAMDEQRRDLIAEHTGILTGVYQILNTTKKDAVVMACIWVVINLGWLDNVQQRSGEGMSYFHSLESDTQESASERSNVLKNMGFIPLLKRVLDRVESLEVKERIKVALGNLER